MNREKLRELLGDSATDELVDAIMAANGKDVNKANAGLADLRKQLDEANARAKQLEDDANKSLTAEEQWQKQLDEANAAAAAANKQLNEMSAVAVFAGAGIPEDEYRPFLGSITGGTRKDAETAANAIAAVVSAKVKAAEDSAAKKALGGMNPPAGGAEPNGTVASKKDFEALAPEAQMKWVHDNPGQLSQLR